MMQNKVALLFLIAIFICFPSSAQTFGATTTIWQQRSLYRNIIVLEGNGHRCLTFGKRSARQSCIETDNPGKLIFGYTQRMFEALVLVAGARRVLVIGIGGGSLPMAIRAGLPDIHVDAVELDKEIVDVAMKYFHFRPDDRLSVFSEDGRVFVRKSILSGVKYDAILLDAFDKDYIPEHMATIGFLQQVQSILTRDGILLANTYQGTSYQAHEEATFQAVFGDIYESKIPNGNRVIIAGQGADAVARRIAGARIVGRSAAKPLTDRYSPANALLLP